MGTELQPTNGAAGMVATQELGSRSLEVRAETASMAVAAQAAAMVRARYGMALERPRDIMVVRRRLLDALARPRFSETARYCKPVGGGEVRGWSIRFAEEVARAYGNIYPETMSVYENARQRILRVSVTDLEANLCYVTDITVEKTVERRNPKGYEVVGERVNKQGQTVYVVVATDDDLQVKQNALISKALRNAIMRLVPADILEDCLDAYHASLKGQGSDPTQAIKKLADGFTRLGIPLEQVAEYLGHPLDQSTPDERDTLKQIGVAISDKETTWPAVMAQKAEERTQAGDQEPAPVVEPPKQAKTTADLKARAKADKHIIVKGTSGDVIATGAPCEACGLAEGHKINCPLDLAAREPGAEG